MLGQKTGDQCHTSPDVAKAIAVKRLTVAVLFVGIVSAIVPCITDPLFWNAFLCGSADE